jgi:FixJ family two-component response regulator
MILSKLPTEVVSMSLGTPTVFVVDDDISVRDSLRLLLESAGWQSQTFSSAREFLDRPRIHAGPCCLVLDAGLPDFSRLEFTDSPSADRYRMPTILISGSDARAVAARGMEIGAVAAFPKPLEADALLRAIEEAVKVETQRGGSHSVAQRDRAVEGT